MCEHESLGAEPGHLDERAVLDWLEGRISNVRRATHERHIDACAECRRLLATIARALDGTSEDERGSPGTAVALACEVAPGMRIGGYHVETLLGRGAMGSVFRAIDPRLGRAVALKLVRHRDVSAARVRREARALAKLSHPHVVTVLAAGASEAGPWIAMELVEGLTLDQWARRRDPAFEERAEALRDAARGLAAVHDAGIVHGDLKPANILVGDDGRVRVADFGLASTSAKRESAAWADALGVSLPEAPTTSLAGRGGTPAYMAPEVLCGGRPTFRSDQFSWCVTAWELLAGKRPFEAASREGLAAVIAGGAPAGGKAVRGRWSAVLRRGLSCDPACRFASVAELMRALQVPPGRRIAAAGIAVGLTTAALAWGLAPAADRCEHAGAAAARLGSLMRRPETAGALRLVDRPVDRELAAVNGWLDAWAPARRQACDRSDSRTAACLDDAVAVLEGRLAALEEASVPDAGLLEDIDGPAACSAGPNELPPEHRSPRKQALRRELSRLKGRYDHRADETGLRAFTSVAAQADALGDPSVSAPAWFSVAQMEDKLGRRDVAADNYEHAYFEALAADTPDLAMRAAASVAQILGTRFADLSGALIWLQHARAVLPRVRDATARAELELVHGELLQGFGRLDEAGVHLRAAEAALPPAGALRVRAAVGTTLGHLAIARGDFAGAIVMLERAIAIHEATGAEGNKNLPRALNGLAVAYAQLGKTDAAAEVWLRASALVGATSRRALKAAFETNLGALRALQGDHEAALRHYAIGCAASEDALGSAGPEAAACHYNMALAHYDLEHWDEAVAAARRAVIAATQAEPPVLWRAVDPLSTLAAAQGKLGDVAGATSTQLRRIAAYQTLLADPERDPNETREGLVDARLDLAELRLRVRDRVAARRLLADVDADLAELAETSEAAESRARVRALRSRAR